MPEAAEVKLSCEVIKSMVQGSYINSMRIYENSRYNKILPENMRKIQEDIRIGKNIFIQDIQCHGKFIYWTLSEGWYLLNGFGMTGQWSKDIGNHPCFSFDYCFPPTRGLKTLFFNDTRHFGFIKFVKEEGLNKKLNSLGWDPFKGLTEDNISFIVKKLQSSSKLLPALLMDQSIVSGLGNYIKAEALYQSGISPHRRGKSLTNQEIKILCLNIKDVMDRSYQYQGASFKTYKNVEGDKGKFSTFFKVYSKKTDPLGNKVIKESLNDGRSTYWVPEIQK